MSARVEGGASALPDFDARGFLREFEAIGGRVVSNGQSFAVIYPAETDIIPTEVIDWGAIIAEAHNRAIYGPS